ncbi:uncharacterized protein LOC136754782 [Amia ocellicauda]|uniref:uncharacterized protein LOC136754782 n=1 Tax=Amia ocellicauda TaxID=2972642 RepID=UPI003463C873
MDRVPEDRTEGWALKLGLQLSRTGALCCALLALALALAPTGPDPPQGETRLLAAEARLGLQVALGGLCLLTLALLWRGRGPLREVREGSETVSVPVMEAQTEALLSALHSCLSWEPLGGDSLPHIQALSHRLESVLKAVHSSGVSMPRQGRREGSKDASDSMVTSDPPGLTDRLQHLDAFLRHRLVLLARLLQVQEELCERVQGIVLWQGGSWVRLGELHRQASMGGGARDLCATLTQLESFSAELGQYQGALEVCHSQLTDASQLLQALASSLEEFRADVGSQGQDLQWTECVDQENIEQFEAARADFLSLVRLTSYLRCHLEFQRQWGGGVSVRVKPALPPASPAPRPPPAPSLRGRAPRQPRSVLCGRGRTFAS